MLEICCQIIWHLLAGFKNSFLWSAHSLWFTKYVFSAKIWLVKTSTWIVKYKSWVVKLNLVWKLFLSGLRLVFCVYFSDWLFLGFSGLMLVPCGDGQFAIWSADAPDIWFDDEWNCFDWSVVIERCETWFSVWDWQDTNLVVCFMNCKRLLLRGYCTWDTSKIVLLY